jgi:hexosaminidase
MKFVLAPSDYYYVDCGVGNKYGGSPSWCDPYKSWWIIYDLEPTDYLNDGSIIGGELAAWSELNS